MYKNIVILLMLLIICNIFIISCNKKSTAPLPVYVGTSYAAEDENYVYFLDNYSLYLFDRASGEITKAYGEYYNLALINEKLYLNYGNLHTTPTHFLIDTPTLVHEPYKWRKDAEVFEPESHSRDMKIYGNRIALLSCDFMGEVSSVAIDYTDKENFTELQRFIIGYDAADDEYYYLRVVPSEIFSYETDAQLNYIDTDFYLDFYLMKGDRDIYRLMSSNYGGYSYNTFCAIYGGYIYYPQNSKIMRRSLKRISWAETVYSNFDEDKNYLSSELPLAYKKSNGFEFNALTLHYWRYFQRTNFLAVTTTGVYVKDNSGQITLISHDGSRISTCEHKYDYSNRYFVSDVDGEFKFVNVSGGYGIVK